jgi:hypothetical protein
MKQKNKIFMTFLLDIVSIYGTIYIFLDISFLVNYIIVLTFFIIEVYN